MEGTKGGEEGLSRLTAGEARKIGANLEKRWGEGEEAKGDEVEIGEGATG